MSILYLSSSSQTAIRTKSTYLYIFSNDCILTELPFARNSVCDRNDTIRAKRKDRSFCFVTIPVIK